MQCVRVSKTYSRILNRFLLENVCLSIFAQAYKAFANRVLNLKRKLDALKATLPDAESPVPSPSEDAPSPSGSESPFHGLGRSQRTKEEKDNRDVEDMDMSDEETANTTSIIGELSFIHSFIHLSFFSVLCVLFLIGFFSFFS